MKKTILMTLAALGLAGMAQADTIVANSDFYTSNDNGWLYVWTGNGDNDQTSNYANWGYYQNASSTVAGSSNGNVPGTKAQTFIGWDMTIVDGTQVLTSNETACSVTLTNGQWLGAQNATGEWYIGSNVTVTGTNVGIGGTTGALNSFSFYFADLATSNSSITLDTLWIRQTNITLEGTLNMTGSDFSKVLFTGTNMQQSEGIWDASSFIVTDANGQALTYAGSDSGHVGEEGYFWLETKGGETVGSTLTVTIVAKATPEPTTATLSLLALAGLCARRRRK